jgi:ATP/ADP translocase
MDKLRQLFRVHKGEGLKVLFFAVLGALLQAGVAIGVSTGDSLFIVHVGAAKLPVLYMIMPFVMLVFVAFYSFLMARYPVQQVLYVSLGLIAAGSVAFYHILAVHHGHAPRLIYYFAKIFSGIWFIALYTVYWNFADNYFDIQDAKRLYPVFSGGGATGAMIGGALVRGITVHHSVDMLYLVWMVIAFITFPVAIILVKKWKAIETDDEPEEAGSVGQQIKGTFASLAGSNYVRVFLAILFIGVVLNTVDEYQYSQIFQYKGYSAYSGNFSLQRSDVEVARIFGMLFAAVNVFNLIINFFLFNRMVTRLGVGNMTMIGPVTYLITFVVLLMSYGYPAGVLGFFAYQGIITSIDWNNANFLFNAVPANFKAQVRTFAEGLLEPLATAAAGAFLFVVGEKKWLPNQISAVGVIIAGVYFLIALAVRSGYLGAIVTNLKQEWLDFSRPEEAVLTGLDPEERTLLVERARCMDCKLAHSAIRILWMNDRIAAVDSLLNVMSQSAANMDESVPLLEMMLRDEDPQVIGQVREWLGHSGVGLTASVLEELGNHGLVDAKSLAHLSASDNPGDRAAAASASWASSAPQNHATAREIVDSLLKGDREQVAAGVRALGRSRDEKQSHFVEPYFEDADPTIRHEAHLAVSRLATADSTHLVPELLHAIENGGTEDREICMDTLAKIGAADSIAPLLALSELFSPFERRKAELVLRDIGLKSVPATVAVLRDGKYPYIARSIAARALAQLAFPQLEAVSNAIIHTEIRRAYEYLNDYRALENSNIAGAGVVVLSRYYRDMQSIVVDFVLELLSVGGRLPDFELISASLRSDNRRDRANAIETIEQGVDRAIFKVLLPLVDTTKSADEMAKFIRANVGSANPTPSEIARRAIASSSPLEAAAGAQLIADLNEGDAKETLRQLLRNSASPLMRDTVVSLVLDAREKLNPIERLRLLGDADFFQQLHTQDLAIIGRDTTQIEAAAGKSLVKAGGRMDNVYIVASGTLSIGSQSCVAGQVAGFDAVLGSPISTTDIVSNGATLLRLHVEDILSAARTYSNIAIALLAERLNVADADEDDDEEIEDDLTDAGDKGALRI